MRTKFRLESIKRIRPFVRRTRRWEDNIKIVENIVGRRELYSSGSV
jgi:hypothetical protein